MTRGSFRVQFALWTALTIFQTIFVVVRITTPGAWELVSYAYLAGLLLSISTLGYLLYVRHYDGHFWDEEAAEEDEWERRGRAL
ncbi:hypothetical protein ACX80D_05780 [Arthrobacter sp. Sr24]